MVNKVCTFLIFDLYIHAVGRFFSNFSLIILNSFLFLTPLFFLSKWIHAIQKKKEDIQKFSQKKRSVYGKRKKWFIGNWIPMNWIQPYGGVEPPTLRLRVSRSADWASKASWYSRLFLNLSMAKNKYMWRFIFIYDLFFLTIIKLEIVFFYFNKSKSIPI